MAFARSYPKEGASRRVYALWGMCKKGSGSRSASQGLTATDANQDSGIISLVEI
jgi:hypothetical protein